MFMNLRGRVRHWPVVQRLTRSLGRCFGPLWLNNPDALRNILARKFLTGDGLEIGALDKPQLLPRCARARYVDRMPLSELQAAYSNVKHMVPVAIVDDGERLNTVSNETQDFLIANHFLEHTQNPIGTIRRFLEVLRTGGVLFLCIPDKRGTFDADRPVTPLEHLQRDDSEGPAWSYRAHIEEFVRLAMKQTGSEAEATVEHFCRTNYSIHFHVFTAMSLWEMLASLRSQLSFEVLAFVANDAMSETICVLKKS